MSKFGPHECEPQRQVCRNCGATEQEYVDGLAPDCAPQYGNFSNIPGPGTDLTEASLEAALVAIKRNVDEARNKLTLTPTMYLKPPGMTDEEFWDYRRRLVEEAAPLLRDAFGCKP